MELPASPYQTPREPPASGSDVQALFLAYLDYYRSVVLGKLEGLTDTELDRTRLPSGWTPRQLLKHLTFMEQRWFCWGFAGEAVEDPFGDHEPGHRGRWLVRPEESTADLVAAFVRQWERSRAILAAADLRARAADSGRFAGTEPPRLVWICFHVLQEYARHAGHLDIVRELADGATGE